MQIVFTDGSSYDITEKSTDTIAYIPMVYDLLALLLRFYEDYDNTLVYRMDDGQLIETPDRVFVGFELVDRTLLRCNFAISLEEENKRLQEENDHLRQDVTLYQDKANAYDILVNGQPETEQTE